MAKLTLNDLASLTNEATALSLLNANFAAIETAIENTYSLDGTLPNAILTQFDANAKRLINVADPVSNQDAATKHYVDTNPGPTGATGATGATGGTGATGATGSQGNAGWAPVFAIQSDSARRVFQLNDWTGGAGSKPGFINQYLGASGFTAVIASAIDVRGPTGAAGAGTGDMVAANNLSDVSNTTTARANLGLTIGTNVQAFDSELAALAGLVSAADKLPYFTGAGTASLADFTAAGRALVDDADAAAQRTTLGLGTIATQAASNVNITGGVISGITDLPVADGGTGASTASAARTNLGLVIATDVEAHHARLTDISGITYAQGDLLYHNGSNIVKLAAGTSGQFLKTLGAAANPTWAASGGGLALVTNTQLTSDATSVSFTGLSTYDLIHVHFVLSVTANSATVSIEGRVSAGTYRTWSFAVTSATNPSLFWGSFTISNFGTANPYKIFTVHHNKTQPTTVDASDTIVMGATGTNDTQNGYCSYQEIWDELRISTNVGNIQGTIADQRGYFSVYGIPK